MARNTTPTTFLAIFGAQPHQEVPLPEVRYTGEDLDGYKATLKARGIKGPGRATPWGPNTPRFTAGAFTAEERGILGARVNFSCGYATQVVPDGAGTQRGVSILKDLDADPNRFQLEGWVSSLSPHPGHVWVRTREAFHSVPVRALRAVKPFQAEVLAEAEAEEVLV